MNDGNCCPECDGVGHLDIYKLPGGGGFKVRLSRLLVFHETYPDAIHDGVTECVCMANKRIERLWGNSAVPFRRTHCTFENFDALREDYHKGKEEARYYAGLMAAREPMIFNDEDKNGLVLSGLTGMGKSGLMAAVAMQWIAQGIDILWVDFNEFLAAIRKSYEDDSEVNTSTIIESAQRASLLCLDDFGDMALTVAVTPHTRDKTYDVIRYRYENMLPIMITTNLSTEQMYKQFSSRISDRVAEMCHWVTMGGKNLRFK